VPYLSSDTSEKGKAAYPHALVDAQWKASSLVVKLLCPSRLRCCILAPCRPALRDRPFLPDRFLFVTVRLLKRRSELRDADFHFLAPAFRAWRTRRVSCDMGAPDQPLTLGLQSLPHSLRSGQALSGAKGPHLCCFLLFQPLGQQVAQGPPSGPAAIPAARVGAASQTRESEFPLPASETPFRKHLGRTVKTTARWKSRKAGERALRYIFSCVPPNAMRPPCFSRPLPQVSA